MSRIKYREAIDLYPTIYELISILELDYIDVNRIKILYSFGSESSAYARIHGISRVLQIALDTKPIYVIELISENFNSLRKEDKIKVLIHELLHIPKTFSGALRAHGRYVNQKIIDKFYHKYVKTKKH